MAISELEKSIISISNTLKPRKNIPAANISEQLKPLFDKLIQALSKQSVNIPKAPNVVVENKIPNQERPVVNNTFSPTMPELPEIILPEYPTWQTINCKIIRDDRGLISDVVFEKEA